MKTSKTVTVAIRIVKRVVYTQAVGQCHCSDDGSTLTTTGSEMTSVFFLNAAYNLFTTQVGVSRVLATRFILISLK